MTIPSYLRAPALSVPPAIFFMSPAILIALAIVLPPLAYVLIMSVNGANLTLDAFQAVLTSALFKQALGTTLYIAAASAVTSLILGFIVALHLARQTARRRAILMMLVLVPFWTSILVKCFAFTIILGREGIINSLLSFVFGTKIHLSLMLNMVGLLVGMANYLVPLVVLPVLASLLAIDASLYRAAAIMGAKPARIFWSITVPLSLPGVMAGLSSIFVMSLGAFIVPALLGGSRNLMLSNLVDFYNREVLDWPKAAAISVILFAMALALAIPLSLLRRRKA